MTMGGSGQAMMMRRAGLVLLLLDAMTTRGRGGRDTPPPRAGIPDVMGPQKATF